MVTVEEQLVYYECIIIKNGLRIPVTPTLGDRVLVLEILALTVDNVA